MRHRTLIAGAVLAATLIVPGTARAAGGYPFGAEAGPAGVTASGAAARYVTLNSSSATLIERIARTGGQVLAWRTVHGQLSVPAVAMDGTAGGLSADDRTLVLIRPQNRFPIARTQLAIADPATLRTRTFDLKGDFTFDAISPDGRSLFLVQYVSPHDTSRYAVRVYDTRARRLLRDVIVDRRDPGEQMRGSPLTRTTSSDGRWAYTLYDGAGKTPFIHALDTTARRAFCIDLDALRGSQELFSLRMQLTGHALRLMDHDEAVAAVDTTTLRVSTPAPAAPAGDRGESRRGTAGAAWPWVLGAALVGALGVATVMVTRRRRTITAR